jgi:hypothetical protein
MHGARHSADFSAEDENTLFCRASGHPREKIALLTNGADTPAKTLAKAPRAKTKPAHANRVRRLKNQLAELERSLSSRNARC